MEELAFYPYQKLHKYPGMMPLDVAIWERFIANNPSAFDACAYNVAVGEGTPHDTVVNKESGGDINRLYQRKIDVVAKAKGGFVVIEIKPRASTSVFGQVKGYARLFARDYPNAGTVDTLVITDELLPEMEFLAKEEKVLVLVA